MKKLRLMTLLMGLALFLTLTACSDEASNDEVSDPQESTEVADSNDNPVELGELTVGLMPSIDAFPIVIAYDRGYFEDEGLMINLEPFSNAADRDAALQAGLLDVTLFDLVAVGLSREADITPLKVTGSTTGRFTLVTNEGFESIEDLAGETVVIAQNTAIDFVLDHMVDLAGFDAEHIERLSIPAIPTRLEYLREGNATAALLPEPWSTMAIAEGFSEITNTIEIGFMPFVTAFTDTAVEEMPEEIKAFYRAYNRGVDYLNESELDDYFHIMVDVIGFPAEVGEHLDLPTFEHNQMPEDDVLEAAISWLLSRDLITEGMTPDDLIDRVAFE